MSAAPHVLRYSRRRACSFVHLIGVLAVLVLLGGCEATARPPFAASTSTATALATATTTATSAPTSTPDLADSSPFVGLYVLRISVFVENEVPAFEATATNAARIAELYAAIRALPLLATNKYESCPYDFGAFYQLTFTHADGVQITGYAGPGGCQHVVLDGDTVRFAVDVQSFWPLFAATLGVSTSTVRNPPSGVPTGPYAPTPGASTPEP